MNNQENFMASTIINNREEKKNIDFPGIFSLICLGKKSGTLVFQGPGAVKKVFFENGDVLYASSTLDKERLGDCLVRDGKITQQQYDEAQIILKESGKKLGSIITKLRYVTPQALVDGARSQVKSIILSLFSWPCTCGFEEGPLRPEEIVPLRISTANLKSAVLEGMNRIDPEQVRNELPAETVLRKIKHAAPSLFQTADLSPEQQKMLSSIDGKRTIGDLCGLDLVDEPAALKTVYALLAFQFAEKREPLAAGEKKKETPRAEVTDKKEGPVDDRQRLLQAFEAIETLDYYQVLGLGRTAAAGELRQAYRNLAKKYHPDLHVGRDLVDVQDKAEALFMRVSEAYATLSNGARRAEYDQMLRKGPGGRHGDTHSSRVDKKEVAAVQFELGMKSYQSGDFWSAAEAFTSACDFDPTNARYFYHKGLALIKVPKRGHDAEKSLEEAIRLDPKTDYYIELGNFYLRYGSKALASSQFKEALQKDPDSEPAKQGLLAAQKDNAAS